MKRLRNSVVKWLVVSLLCLLLGFLLGKFKQDILAEQLSVLTSQLHSVEAQSNSLQTELSHLQVGVTADQQTIKALTQTNKQLQDELSVANNKLFFYQRVVAPELETTGVKVYSFELSKNQLQTEWQYQLVLMQSQKDRRFLSGKFDIFFSVFEGDTLKQLALSDLSMQVSERFKFKYFQTIQGSFSLPDGISVDEVIVKLTVAGNRWHKAQSVEERYDWRVLSAQDSADLSEFDSNERPDAE